MHPLNSLRHIRSRIRKRTTTDLEFVLSETVQTISLLPLQIPIYVEARIAIPHIHALAFLYEFPDLGSAFLYRSFEVFGYEEVVGSRSRCWDFGGVVWGIRYIWEDYSRFAEFRG